MIFDNVASRKFVLNKKPRSFFGINQPCQNALRFVRRAFIIGKGQLYEGLPLQALLQQVNELGGLVVFHLLVF